MKALDILQNQSVRKAAFPFLLTIYVFWLFSLYRRQTGGMDDFDVFFKAGERLQNGENIFGPPHYYNLKYFYSVLFASGMSLLQVMGIAKAKLLWFILNTVLFIRIFHLLGKHVWKDFPKTGILLFILLLITGKMVLVNYTYNQISVLILWTMLEAYVLMIRNRILSAVLVLCIGINIKVMPVVLAPLFILWSADRFKTLVYGLLFLAAGLFLPALWLGWDYNMMLMGEWWNTLNPVSEIHVMQTYEYGFTDISSLVTKYLSAEPVYLEPDIHIADLSMKTLFLITNFIRLALLLPALWLVYKVREPILGVSGRFIAASAFMALIPLCFPHQREYSFMFFIPLLSVHLLMLFSERHKLYSLVFVLLVLFSGMLAWEDLVGRGNMDMFRNYRLITVGMTGIYLQFVFLCIRMAGSGVVSQYGNTEPSPVSSTEKLTDGT